MLMQRMYPRDATEMSSPILHGMPTSRLLLFFLARHRKNREAASELLMRLKDNRDLQKFLQDCQEVNNLLSVVSPLATSCGKASLPPICLE